MPKVYRIQLSEQERATLNDGARARNLVQHLRERLEMVRLSDLG